MALPYRLPDSASESTPLKSKTHSLSQFASNLNVSKKSDTAQMMRWKQRVLDGFSCTKSVEVFFSEHMQGNVPTAATIDAIETKARATFQVASQAAMKARVEKVIYKPFVAYLTEIVKDFPLKPIFGDTHAKTFKRLHPSDHDSMPDVTGSTLDYDTSVNLAHPDAKWDWSVAGTVIEFKFTGDPISTEGKPSQSQLADLVQLIQNARRIIMASGCCYSFVVSVFGTQARLFRVDRSGYIATDPFDWTKTPKVFPEFYWRLYIGGQPKRMLGADLTVSLPTPQEKKRMYDKLLTVPKYKDLPFEEATADSRWVEAIVNDVSTRCFTVGKPIFQSKGLFCRGTRIDRVLIEGENPAEVHVLKDAWQQECRRPESEFYAVIQHYVNEKLEGKMPVGMTTCIGSHKLADHSDHRTITAVLRTDGDALQDRLHNRTVLKDVGFALDKYANTLTLVRALRDAISGHQLAFEAGVLHRDVSFGNILINESTSVGFIHDWDYSEFTIEGWERFRRIFPDEEVRDLDKHLKDMTGTFPFLAIDLLRARQNSTPFIHECKHDLESFYWILIWILLRHADHSHPNGEYACALVFDKALDADAVATKIAWLSEKRSPDFFRGNPPLSQLIVDLSAIFFNQCSFVTATGVAATHATVLAAFDRAIDSKEWPENDAPRPFTPPFVDQAAIDDLVYLPPASLPARSAGRRSCVSLPPIPFPLHEPKSDSSLKRKMGDLDDGDLDDGGLDDAQLERMNDMQLERVIAILNLERRKRLRTSA